MGKVLIVATLLTLLSQSNVFGQKQGQVAIDSLRNVIQTTRIDTVKVNALNKIASEMTARSKYDSANFYLTEALTLSQKNNYKKGIADYYQTTGLIFYQKGNFSEALKNYSTSLEISKEIRAKENIARLYNLMAIIYSVQGNPELALKTFTESLKMRLELGDKTGIANIYNNIGLIHADRGNYAEAMKNYLSALKIRESIGDKRGIANSMNNLGTLYSSQGNYEDALKNFLLCLRINEEVGDKNALLVSANLNIGNIYSRKLNYKEALNYFNAALTAARQIGDKRSIANAYNAIASCYQKQKNYDEAYKNFMASIEIREAIGDKAGLGSSYLKMAGLYLNQGNLSEGKKWTDKGLALAKLVGNKEDIMNAYQFMAGMDSVGKDYKQAYENYKQYISYRDSIVNKENTKKLVEQRLQFEFSKKEDSLRLQQTLTDEQLKQQILLSRQQQQELLINHSMLQLAEKDKELQQLAFLKTEAELQNEQNQRQEKERLLTIADKEKTVQSTTLKLQQTQLNLKDEELAAQRNKQLFYVISIALLFVVSFFIYRNFHMQRRANNIIRAEKQKSEELLLNILPGEVADEIKASGKARARAHENITVLFTDFVNFTEMSESLSAEEVVSEIDRCFKAFDSIVEKHGLEKIKTIGDGYMAASGLPVADEAHALKAVRAALEMNQYVKENGRMASGKQLEMRIGLHSGRVVAGIVGVKKFAYDIWGDTVNTAARMQQRSEPGEINVSGSTFNLVKSEFAGNYRGKVNAKGKGDVDMYFITDNKNLISTQSTQAEYHN